MDLYVVRHAVAHKRDGDLWPNDSKRPLTPEGEERFRRAAGGILRLVPEVGLVLSSPLRSGVADSGASGASGLARPGLL